MITAIDTSVILDILTASPHYLPFSQAHLRKARTEGKLIVCPLVWGELRPFFDSHADLEKVMDKMSINFDDFGKEAAARAGESWSRYRKAKGPRQRLLTDFMVGAHALTKADRLLTRDRGFYRAYFKKLTILEPVSA